MGFNFANPRIPLGSWIETFFDWYHAISMYANSNILIHNNTNCYEMFTTMLEIRVYV